MNENKRLIEALEKRLDKIASNKTKDWWEKYLKYAIDFRGVNLVNVREEFIKWYEEEEIAKLSFEEQLDLALLFFAEKYAEDKLAGVLFLQIYLSNTFDWKFLVPKFEELFKCEYIHDWNVCGNNSRILGYDSYPNSPALMTPPLTPIALACKAKLIINDNRSAHGVLCKTGGITGGLSRVRCTTNHQ